MKCPLVLQHAKLSRELEKNWETIRTRCDQRDGRWRGRGGRQWDGRQKENDENEKKEDDVQVVGTPEKWLTDTNKRSQLWVTDLLSINIPFELW